MATGLFAATNPLHFEAYPMVRQMEGEIVAMTRARRDRRSRAQHFSGELAR